MSAPRRGWYADPADSGRLRWWNGSAWTEHLAPAPPEPGSLPPSDPTIAGRPGAPTDGASREPTTLLTAPRTSTRRAPMTRPPEVSATRPGRGASRVPRVGLALLGVLAVAAGVAVWVNVAHAPRPTSDRATDTSTPGATLSPSAPKPASTDPAVPDEGAEDASPPATTASGLPTAIDQPWAPIVSPGSTFTFEFPTQNRAGTRRVDALGVDAATLTAAPSPPEGTPLSCAEVDVSKDQMARGTLDLTSQESIARLVTSELGVATPQIEVVPTRAGPATRFGGSTDTETTVRGFVVTTEATALWCVLTVPEAQDTLGSLTIQRIVTTVAVNGSPG